MERNQKLDMRIQATLFLKAATPGVPISSMGEPRSVYLYSLDISICMVCKYKSGTLYDPLPQQPPRAKIFIPLICLPKALHASSRFILYTNISKKYHQNYYLNKNNGNLLCFPKTWLSEFLVFLVGKFAGFKMHKNLTQIYRVQSCIIWIHLNFSQFVCCTNSNINTGKEKSWSSWM